MSFELAAGDLRAKKLPPAAFRPTWRFKGDAIPRILQLLEGAPHPWVHGCCGSATIPGEDRRVDLYHPSGESIDLAVIDQHMQDVGAIIIDPPYPERAWDLPTRQRVVSACARALRPGGRLIIHAPWQPRFPRRYMRLMEPMFLRDDAKLDFPMPPVLLCAYERLPDPPSRRRRAAARNAPLPPVEEKPDGRDGSGGPVHLVLRCPECGVNHVDEGEWATRPHRTHLCVGCGHQWRPHAFPTVGVPSGADSALPPVDEDRAAASMAAAVGDSVLDAEHDILHGDGVVQ